MPTRRRPPSRAFFAWAAAASRPFVCGSERRTIVQPRRSRGQVIAAGFAGGGGAVVAGVVVEGAVGLGRGGRLRCGQRRRAAGGGEAAARRRRDCALLFAVGGDRDRCAGAEDGDHEPEQRGHEPGAGPVVSLGDARRGARDRAVRLLRQAAAALEAVLLTGLRIRTTPGAAGRSGAAHRASPAASTTGRPHVAQKRDPHSSGAPHSQRAVFGTPGARCAAPRRTSSSWMRASSPISSAQRSSSRSSRKRSRRYISSESPPRSRSFCSRSRSSARRSRRSSPAGGAGRRRGRAGSRRSSRCSRGRRTTRRV